MTAPAPETTPSSRPARWVGWDDARPVGSSRFGWMFAAVWLVYLVVPVRTAAHGLPSATSVLALVALMVFAVEFAVFFARLRTRRVRGERTSPRLVWAQIGGMLLLLALAAPGAGEDVIAGAIYVGVTAAMTLPLRQALAAVGGLAAATLLLTRVVPGWTPQDSFVPQLLLASFAAFGVSQILLRNIQLTHARQQLLQLAVTQERERLARDVHDILGHSLTVITVKTELAGRLLEAMPDEPPVQRARAEVADVERLAREALADVRATASGLRQVSLTGELAAARQALTAAGIEADLPSAVDDVPARFRELFAWALREGVTNVVRHSGASRCIVRLGPDFVEIRDDGRGPADSAGGGSGGGSGLVGLRGRAAAARARVEAGRSPEGGFSLRVVAGGRS